MRSDRRVRLLFLSQPFLYPQDSGGKIRTAQLLRHLRRHFDITLVSNVDPRKDAPHVDRMRELCDTFHGVPRSDPARDSAAYYLAALRRAFSPYPVSVIADYSPAVVRCLRRMVAGGEHDLLVCDFVHASLNVREFRTLPRLLFQHNVESTIVERHAEAATNPLLRRFWRAQWRKMLRFERAACPEFDAVVTVSELDRAVLAREFGARNVSAIPTAVDAEFFRPAAEPPEDSTLVFTGAMDWLPNEDAILFFVEQILDPLRSSVPRVRLLVVGRSPSRRLLDRTRHHPEIQITGRVDDVRPFMARGAVYVIPLRIGGGTRIKAYEAMAMGKAVVSTRVGVEGLPLTDGETVVLADRPEEFAAATARLLKDTQERQQIGARARAHVEAHASWPRAADVFAAACRRIARA